MKETTTVPPRYGWWPRMMDWNAAAAYLGISVKSLERYVEAGKVAMGKYEAPESDKRLMDKILFDRTQLDRFVERYFR